MTCFVATAWLFNLLAATPPALAGAAGMAPAPAGEELSRDYSVESVTGIRFGPDPATQSRCEVKDGAIIRGPKDRKRLAVVFTGHDYAEGAETILSELTRRDGHGSFFLTGALLAAPQSEQLLRRLQAAGHYVGPHSDNHLLYCSWDGARTTLVTREEFRADLARNIAKLSAQGARAHEGARYFLPPFEQYNSEIATWSAEMGMTLINFTPGTRSNADYTGESDANFVSSQTIFDSIVKREQEDPFGLNGFILLLHIGSGPGRQDKFHERFGELLDYLDSKGYQFVRVDELLAPKQ
ncbi:MAG: polysaccharide deacetylase family protein [Verrucomicrobiia bacterium]